MSPVAASGRSYSPFEVVKKPIFYFPTGDCYHTSLFTKTDSLAIKTIMINANTI